MEKRSGSSNSSSYPYNNNNNNKLKLNLKQLPPIDPYSITSTKNHQVKNEIPSFRIANPKEEMKTGDGDNDASLICLTKHIDPNSTNTASCKIEARSDGASQNDSKIQASADGASQNDSKIQPSADRASPKDSKIQGASNKVVAKSKLLEICAANHWKPPLFECCYEEGPRHKKVFTYKVTFMIESSNTVLECFGVPQSKKKTAAESAAEGALWFLEHLGYFPIKKQKK